MSVSDPREDPRYQQLLDDVVADIRDLSLQRVLVAGAQGSGKSTLAGFLNQSLARAGVRSVVLSIDDFYCTLQQRQQLAASVHPNFLTRGVPGTHDVAWLHEALTSLTAGEQCEVPVFNKAEDNRQPGTVTIGPADVVILEGWCVGARPQSDAMLVDAVNNFEAMSDPEGIWRRAVNQFLASTGYQQCFAADLTLFLAVPDFDSVFRWRCEQEMALNAGSKVMSNEEILAFIQYYQRITEWMLADLAPVADVLVNLDQKHRVSEIVRRA